MMKARIAAALLVALVTLPAAAWAQEAGDRQEDRNAVELERVAQNNLLRSDAAADAPVGPRAVPPRFEDYALEPAVESRFATAEDAAVMRPPTRGSKALMIAGAALLVAGLIIGDDAGTFVAVAGAGIGAYGVYLYFE
ncbi:MAG TPA: hypothetical protein VK837_14530 [Longimicrobiales bacterium]|nr:hypothetical protein [Longimicrobiales bacterium]